MPVNKHSFTKTHDVQKQYNKKKIFFQILSSHGVMSYLHDPVKMKIFETTSG